MKNRNRALKSGEIILVDFPGVNLTKRRPAVIVSSALYHRERPDVIIGLITSQVDSATALTDYVLEDWIEAKLLRPSAFRAFLITLPKTVISSRLGKVSGRDWTAIVKRVRSAIY